MYLSKRLAVQGLVHNNHAPSPTTASISNAHSPGPSSRCRIAGPPEGGACGVPNATRNPRRPGPRKNAGKTQWVSWAGRGVWETRGGWRRRRHARISCSRQSAGPTSGWAPGPGGFLHFADEPGTRTMHPLLHGRPRRKQCMETESEHRAELPLQARFLPCEYVILVVYLAARGRQKQRR